MKLLGNYSFLIPGNPNRIPLYLWYHLNPKDPFYKNKVHALANNLKMTFIVGALDMNAGPLSMLRLALFDKYDGTTADFR